MEREVLRRFQAEVERQCRFALIAGRDIKEAHDKGDMERVWYSIQQFLVSAANISKLLWPSHDSRAKLRASLSVDGNKDHVLRLRKLRNHFEHFDERLEKWARLSKGHNFIDSNIGPHNMGDLGENEDRFRNFDPTDFSVSFWGEVYRLQPMIDAIENLCKKAKVEAQKPRLGLGRV